LRWGLGNLRWQARNGHIGADDDETEQQKKAVENKRESVENAVEKKPEEES
jgi:hypothetical protein